MYRFNMGKVGSTPSCTQNLNTTHVSVQLKTKIGVVVQLNEFKYNSCIGSMIEHRIVDEGNPDLNTTHVSVQ